MYIGIDGCKGGWLCVTIDEAKQIEMTVISKLEEVIHCYQSIHNICIDMPMGLLESSDEVRACDSLIRKYLGFPRSSSVFPIPCRQAVYASSYEEANSINKTILGKGLSKQTWNICNKIREFDELLVQAKSAIPLFKESHPEVCFKYLNGENLSHTKRSKEGHTDRLRILNRYLPDFENHFTAAIARISNKIVAADDILDAGVLAINSMHGCKNGAITFPDHPPVDNRDIPMQVYLGRKS